jgi:predicted transcriptional regulator
MSAAKDEVRKLLDNLPDDCTLEDVQYHLYVLEKIQRGLADVEAGRTYTQEEAEARIAAKWRT